MSINENRVIARTGARELSQQELDTVAAGGGIPNHTNTACVVSSQDNSLKYTDIGECGPPV